MKILRSVTRRGFRVEPAGFYTLLKLNKWFPASRLPVPFRYRTSQSAQPPTETTTPNIITLRWDRRSPVRQVLIVIVAAGIVWAMLLWIMHP